MPGLGSKGKSGKGNMARPARSRNSTPGFSGNASSSIESGVISAFLGLPAASLAVPNNVLYDDIMERHGGMGGIPDFQHLQTLISDLNILSSLAESREVKSEKGVRSLGTRRSERESYDKETETLAREKARLKRAAEGDEGKDSRPKRRRDQHKPSREERPMAIGAHGVAKQDGIDVKKHVSPGVKAKPDSGSSSPLSLPSQLHSPIAETSQPSVSMTARPDSASSSSSDDSHQRPPANSIPQYQTFGANPLTFDDPTVYHIREVTDEMTDEEKKDIYCVAMFPRSDLKELTAGTPPDKDFSNAKPSNQVAATTFATYLEPYMRPFGDEDIAFLKDRGDRGNVFTVNARGPRSYRDIWAEEDGQMSVDREISTLSANQPRGTLEQMNDETAQTDQISLGPLTERVLSLMRSERRPPADEKEIDSQQENPALDAADMPAPHAEDGESSATSFLESNRNDWKIPIAKVDYAGIDERLKQELRYIGFLSQEDEPSFDAHWDDEIAERIRVLQAELRRISVENGAKKTLLLEKVKEHMAHQEYQTIQDDLDQQIVQAFLKRNRTLNKPSKNKKRPGGSAAPSNSIGSGVGKPGIGDVARMLIDRRRRWMDTLQGIFDEDFTKAKTEGDQLFSREAMKEKSKLEEENWDDEADVGA